MSSARSLAQAALRLHGAVASSALPAAATKFSSASAFPHALTSRESEEQQQQQQPTPSATSLPSAVSLLSTGRRAGSTVGLLGTPSMQQHNMPPLHQLQQLRGMAGPPASGNILTTDNTWAQFRATHAVAKGNDLSQAMYAMIITFTSAWWFNDLMGYPPRVLGMLAFLTLLLYTRRPV